MWLSQHSQKIRYHDSICDYLKSAGVNYHTIDLLANPPFEFTDKKKLFRGVIFQDDQGMVMAIVPSDGLLDVSLLNQQLNRQLELVPLSKLDQLYLPCQSTSYPPLSEYFGLTAIIDESIYQVRDVLFQTGIDNILIDIKRDAFIKLQQEHGFGKITIPLKDLMDLDNRVNQHNDSIMYLTPLRMKQRLRQTFRLPAMPTIAGKILKLRFDPRVSVNDLTDIIEKDPSLSAQLISWVQSPYHGWRGKISTIEDAITKILGYDLVVNLTLMTALGQPLKMPLNGPFGLRAYWYRALSTAHLVAALVEQMPSNKQPPKGLAYLSGLLHNLGHFLLAQLFPSYFQLLNQLIDVNPHIPLTIIEQYAFGIDHDQLGVWLMQSWYLPPEIVTAAEHYQDEAYHDKHAIYVQLVSVATQLLAQLDEPSHAVAINHAIMKLGITEKQALMALEKLLCKQEQEIMTMMGGQ